MSVVKSLNDKDVLRTVVGELQKNIQNCFEIRVTRKVCKSVPGLRTLRGVLKHFKSRFFPILTENMPDRERCIHPFANTYLVKNIFTPYYKYILSQNYTPRLLLVKHKVALD